MQLSELARAKVNLTLRVHGRRADGYHELESLVAFADSGDRLTLDLARPVGFETSGPFASALGRAEGNLVLDAMAACARAFPGLRLGHVTLDKRLPIAAGIGGGSADAAALLRLAQQANPQWSADADGWHQLALGLGADVPVCLTSRLAVMIGTGDGVVPVAATVGLPAVLVNAQLPVPANKTAAVFRALSASPLDSTFDPAAYWMPGPRDLADPKRLLDVLLHRANDLEPVTTQLMPTIAAVLDGLRAQTGIALARMSGAGPTCFGLFETSAQATAAADALARAHPTWWVQATVLS